MLRRRTIILIYAIFAVAIAGALVSHYRIATGVSDRLAKRRAIESTIVPILRLRNASLQEALAALPSVGQGLIVIETPAPTDPITLTLFDVSFDHALNVILDQASSTERLRWAWVGDHIVINPISQPVKLRVYDLRGLSERLDEGLPAQYITPHDTDGGLFGAAGNVGLSSHWTGSELMDLYGLLIEEAVRPETWMDSGGVPGSINGRDGRLFIRQTNAAHQQIERLLNELWGVTP